NKPVLHIVERFTVGQRIDLGTGTSAPLARDLELWYDDGTGVFRAVARIDGRVISRTSGRATANDLASEDPEYLSTIYRSLLKQGKLHQSGVATIRGRKVILVSWSSPSGRIRAALDATTYRLVQLRYYGRAQAQLDVLEFDTVSRADAELPNPPPGQITAQTSTSSGFGSGSGISLAKARRLFGAPPFWLGRSVDGHRLTGVSLNKETDTGRGRTVHGATLDFQYGVTAKTDAYVDIEEAPAAVAAPLWSFQSEYAPPAGYLDLTHDNPGWTGLMQKNGFYVSLTGRSRGVLIRAAKELVPLPPSVR
ncbi:MAG TPA: hypothetical protein VLJ76_05540, partial [Gaiellaceae bacterium]|nr:hypothetical protein [Gaiellaceae bacterium]